MRAMRRQPSKSWPSLASSVRQTGPPCVRDGLAGLLGGRPALLYAAAPYMDDQGSAEQDAAPKAPNQVPARPRFPWKPRASRGRRRRAGADGKSATAALRRAVRGPCCCWSAWARCCARSECCGPSGIAPRFRCSNGCSGPLPGEPSWAAPQTTVPLSLVVLGAVAAVLGGHGLPWAIGLALAFCSSRPCGGRAGSCS